MERRGGKGETSRGQESNGVPKSRVENYKKKFGGGKGD